MFIPGEIQDMLAEAVSEDGSTAWRCLVCGKDFQKKSNGKRHVETMHCEAPSYKCQAKIHLYCGPNGPTTSIFYGI